ncbi:anti-sigma-I factor RsgI-like [Cydia pomonella]|uniref:anti-sigma-I factor RsgI-like n=2 Tax=Cydia pomonella TaxID=82600 RepID=UPI002ADD528E|nr:anti-sigma-I factor RsgI-like [Cydia pomonella]
MAKDNLNNRYNIQQFSGDGFNNWSFRIKSILKENLCLEAIQTVKYAENKDNEKMEARAQAILIAAVADSHLEYVREETAYAMFKNLEECFKEKGIRSKLFLRRQLSDIKYKDTTSLKEHFTKIQEICTQLEEAGSELSEEEKINYVLLSMPKSYESIVTALETIGDLKLNTVKDRLLAEEEKQKKFNEYQASQVQSNAFNCFTCGKPGHKKFQCRQSHGYGFNQGHGRGEWSHGYGFNQGHGRGGWSQGYGFNQGHGRGGWNQGRGFYQGRGQSGSYRGTGFNQGRGRGSQVRSRGSSQGRSTNYVEDNDEKTAFFCGNM